MTPPLDDMMLEEKPDTGPIQSIAAKDSCRKAIVNICRRYLRFGCSDTALPLLQFSHQNYPNCVQTRILLGLCTGLEGNPKLGMRILAEIPSMPNTTPEIIRSVNHIKQRLQRMSAK